jgi:hypothetical protein
MGGGEGGLLSLQQVGGTTGGGWEWGLLPPAIGGRQAEGSGGEGTGSRREAKCCAGERMSCSG